MIDKVLDEAAQRALMQLAGSPDAKQRDGALARLLADFHGPALAVIYRTLASAGLGSEHAEEALQAATVRFVTSGLRAYRGEAAPRTYFVRIALHAALDAVRLARRTRALEHIEANSMLHPTSCAAPADQRLTARQRAAALQHCLERLPSSYRRCVELYYLQEAGDCAACAQLVGISAAAFMQRLSRARVRLAACVGNRLGEGRQA